LFATAFSAPSYADISTSFSKAKSNLYKKVYQNSGLTFYTNCEWSKKKVDLASCGLENAFPKKHMNRASRTEAEHIIPASWMLKTNKVERSCVAESKSHKDSPRKYCQKHDKEFRNAHNDLVNLRPAVGQINAYRSNKPFAEQLSGSKPSTYRGNGKQFKVSSRVAVPDISIRGDIARVAFYMRDTYGVTYSKRQEAIFNEWNKQDAVSAEEILLNKQIKKVQGTGNHYVLNL
jgi:deoxyribonuclease-1